MIIEIGTKRKIVLINLFNGNIKFSKSAKKDKNIKP